MKQGVSPLQSCELSQLQWELKSLQCLNINLEIYVEAGGCEPEALPLSISPNDYPNPCVCHVPFSVLFNQIRYI